MAQRVNNYLVRWFSTITGEYDFCEVVQATSPEEARHIAGQGESEKFLEIYIAEVEAL